MDVLLTNYSVHHEDLAILTPYIAQKELIKRKLSNEAKNIKVRTITESQGTHTHCVATYTISESANVLTEVLILCSLLYR